MRLYVIALSLVLAVLCGCGRKALRVVPQQNAISQPGTLLPTASPGGSPEEPLSAPPASEGGATAVAPTPSPTAGPAVGAEAPAVANASAPATHQIYGYRNSTRWFFTPSQAEGAGAAVYGFWYSGPSFKTYQQPTGTCRTALNRCYAPAIYSFFYSTDETCSGHQKTAVDGYVCTAQTAEAPNPVYWVYHSGGTHYYTLSWNEAMGTGTWGFQYQGIPFYVPN